LDWVTYQGHGFFYPVNLFPDNFSSDLRPLPQPGGLVANSADIL
jgi:hypothetical protein